MGILCPRAKLELRVFGETDADHGKVKPSRPGYAVVYVGEGQLEDEGFLDALAEFAHLREARLGFGPNVPDILLTGRSEKGKAGAAGQEAQPGSGESAEAMPGGRGSDRADRSPRDPKEASCEERLAEELERRGADCALPEEPDAFVRSGMEADLAFGSNPFLLNEFFEWLDDAYGDGLGFGESDDEDWDDLAGLGEWPRVHAFSDRAPREPAVGLWGCSNVHLHL